MKKKSAKVDKNSANEENATLGSVVEIYEIY
jgi:hypothetical protein